MKAQLFSRKPTMIDGITGNQQATHPQTAQSRDICDEMEGAPWQFEDGELTTRHYLPLSISPPFLLRYLILQKQIISATNRWYSGSNRVRFHPTILKQRSYFTTGVYYFHCAAFWTYFLLYMVAKRAGWCGCMHCILHSLWVTLLWLQLVSSIISELQKRVT